MDTCWQKVNLAPPPNRCQITESPDLRSLKKVCISFLKILTNQKSLHAEAAILSRMIYRMKTKFRHDKGFKLMEKVNRCLLQYLRLDLASVYGNFTSSIKSSFDGEMSWETSHKMYSPSRQMLEFLILRTLGFIKLFCKAVQYCEEAAIYLQNRIYIGHSWNYALVALSIIARIWCLSKYLVVSACDHYKNIVPYVDKLPYIGRLWNESEAKYPMDVYDWLNVWWISRKSNLKQTRIPQDGNASYLDKLFLEEHSHNSTMDAIDGEELSHLSRVAIEADLGEPVERKIIPNVFRSKKPKAPDVLKEHPPNQVETRNPFHKVKSTKDLLKFIENEEKRRSEQCKSTITKNMDKFQFNLLTKKVHKFVKKLNELDCQEGSDEFKLALRKYKKILKLYIQ